MKEMLRIFLFYGLVTIGAVLSAFVFPQVKPDITDWHFLGLLFVIGILAEIGSRKMVRKGGKNG